ncbi:MAG: response regulator [Paludibacter sp.]
MKAAKHIHLNKNLILKNEYSIENIHFKPEWEFNNSTTGSKYKIGIISGKLLFVSLSIDSNTIEDVKEASLYLDKAFDEGNLQGSEYYKIADYSGMKTATSISVRRYYANANKRINKKYNCNPKCTFICGASLFLIASLKLFSAFVNQNFIFVDTIEKAFEKINLLEDKKVEKSLKIAVEQTDIDELINLCGSIIWDNKNEDLIFNSVSKNNPLKQIGEVLSVVREDILSLEDNYKNLIQNMNSAVLISDNVDKEIIYVNNAALFLLGISKEKLLGQKINNVLCERKGECTNVFDICKPITNKEFKIELSNGDTKYLSLSMTENLFENKTCYIHTFTDISEIKKSQLENERFANELLENKKMLLSTMADLEIEKHNAEAANKSKSEFLANMSHEIRTPLNGVIGFTDLLKNTPLSPVQQQYVNNANVSGRTLLGIINDILDFSKIEAGMMDLEIINTDIIELLGQSVDIIKYSAEKKGLEVLLNIDANTPRFASVDQIRLKQVFTNLLGNAVKFTKSGEIELKVIYDAIDSTQGRFNFSIRDTGIGITKEQQDKLFKVFSQADSSTTRKFGGTGLGLVISEMIVNKMGSKINIQSKHDEGSTFYFDIETTIQHGEKLNTANIQSIKRCLVIDDNENNRIILEHTLTNWEIECDSIDNGLSALKIIQDSEPFDVVICDYHMPYIDGLDTIKMIREKLCLSPEKLPIILLHSSSDDAELHKKCDELGVRFQLNKPVKREDLYSYLCGIQTPLKKTAIIKNSLPDAIQNRKDDLTVLIAEDVDLNMLLIKYLLEKSFPNARILEAINGKEAVLLWQNEKPDLILMDMQMPEMDGIEATLEIRTLEQGSENHTPIIALTAGAMPTEREKCLEVGMDDFLTKPIEQEKLLLTLNRYFNNINLV